MDENIELEGCSVFEERLQISDNNFNNIYKNFFNEFQQNLILDLAVLSRKFGKTRLKKSKT